MVTREEVAEAKLLNPNMYTYERWLIEKGYDKKVFEASACCTLS